MVHHPAAGQVRPTLGARDAGAIFLKVLKILHDGSNQKNDRASLPVLLVGLDWKDHDYFFELFFEGSVSTWGVGGDPLEAEK